METNSVISKGDIFSPSINHLNTKTHNHYIVYLKPYPDNEQLFIGAVLTHAITNGNIPLQKKHFIEKDENGNPYKITFDKSMVSNHPVYKTNDLDLMNIAGRLSEEGIAFVENNIAPYERQFIV